MFLYSQMCKKLHPVKAIIMLLLLCIIISCAENKNPDVANRNSKKKYTIKFKLKGLSSEEIHLERKIRIVLDAASFLKGDSIKIYRTDSDKTIENCFYKLKIKHKQQQVDDMILTVLPTTENLEFVYNNVRRTMPIEFISSYNKIELSQWSPLTLHIVFCKEND